MDVSAPPLRHAPTPGDQITSTTHTLEKPHLWPTQCPFAQIPDLLSDVITRFEKFKTFSVRRGTWLCNIPLKNLSHPKYRGQNDLQPNGSLS